MSSCTLVPNEFDRTNAETCIYPDLHGLFGPCVGTTDTVSEEIVVGVEQVRDIDWDMVCCALRHYGMFSGAVI